MDRLLIGTAATLTQTVTVAEVAVNPSPDAATVTVTRADGTVAVAPTPASDQGTGEYRLDVPAATLDRLDSWTATWAFVLGGEAQALSSYAEVVGGFHFTLAELRALDPLENETTYPTAKLLEARTLAETTIEDACGRAFVPRYRLERRRMRRGRVRTSLADVRAVRSIESADGYAWGAADLAALDVFGSDVVTGTYGWLTSGTVTIGYEHGMDFPPADVRRASLELARWALVEGPSDPRVVTQTFEYGSATLWTPGVRGAVTSLPEVDAVIRRYSEPVVA